MKNIYVIIVFFLCGKFGYGCGSLGILLNRYRLCAFLKVLLCAVLNFVACSL